MWELIEPRDVVHVLPWLAKALAAEQAGRTGHALRSVWATSRVGLPAWPPSPRVLPADGSVARKLAPCLSVSAVEFMTIGASSCN